MYVLLSLRRNDYEEVMNAKSRMVKYNVKKKLFERTKGIIFCKSNLSLDGSGLS